MSRPRRRPAKPVLDEALSAKIALAVRTQELDAGARERMRTRILQRIDSPPPALSSTIRAHEMAWTALDDRVEVALLRRDVRANNQTVLIRMRPGAEIVAHSHTQDEECYVIAGDIEIGGHYLYAGDMHIARAGGSHDRIVSRTGALLMVRSEIPPEGFSLV